MEKKGTGAIPYLIGGIGDGNPPGQIDSQWIVNHLPIGVFVLEAEGSSYKFVHANDSFVEFFGISLDLLKDVPIDSIHRFPFVTPLIKHCETASTLQNTVTFEWQFRPPPNEQFLQCHLIPMADDSGRVGQLLGTITDRSAEKRAERNMLHNALHDSLTGLPNRVLFQEKLEQALEKREVDGSLNYAILIVNVDRFQLINESLGHLAGDEFLITLASRLKYAIRAGDSLARLSGDEFSFLITEMESLDEVDIITQRIHDSLIPPFQLGKSEFHASVTIGVATTLSSPPYPEELIADADFAMHRAKANGRGRTEVFHREKHQAARQQFLLEIDLRKAVAENQMELAYQPIVDINSGEIKAFEALARWQHPERGWISPAEFIPLAEETGLIIEIGRWALFTALQQLADWRSEHPAAMSIAMSVNVANAQLETNNMRQEVEQALKQSGLKGADVRLELTESAFYSDTDVTIARLEDLKETGVLLSLDDFGTGYSSLGYLQNFPLDIIKVDRTFVAEIDEKNNNAKLVEIIALLSKALEIPLVAEGIEEPSQLAFLKNLGCEMGQGYLFSPPVPADAAMAMIRSGIPSAQRAAS